MSPAPEAGEASPFVSGPQAPLPAVQGATPHGQEFELLRLQLPASGTLRDGRSFTASPASGFGEFSLVSTSDLTWFGQRWLLTRDGRSPGLSCIPTLLPSLPGPALGRTSSVPQTPAQEEAFCVPLPQVARTRGLQRAASGCPELRSRLCSPA